MKGFIVSGLFGLLILACSNQDVPKGEDASVGAAVFKKNCRLCHGADGKLGVNGAKDITVSQLTEAERIALITNGKNTMTPFKGVLTPEQIQAVAAYTLTLK